MCRSKIFLATSALGFCMATHASIANADVFSFQNLKPTVVTASFGPGWTTSGEQQTGYLLPSIFNTYVPYHNTAGFLEGEIFLGRQYKLHDWVDGQFGAEVAVTNSVMLGGDIWQQGGSQFNNLYYGYRVNHTHVAFKGKLLGRPNEALRPYIGASLGVGFNRAHNYSSRAKTLPPDQFGQQVNVFPFPNYTDKTQTAFSYTAIAGIQQQLTKEWAAGVGYEFADWGRSQLAAAPGQSVGTGLSLAHLYTNGVQVNVTYTIL
ncbi:MAG: porin family protein [Legionellaceae bacterium]|nr:porin family protein [Legionellaceae bacterium]